MTNPASNQPSQVSKLLLALVALMFAIFFALCILAVLLFIRFKESSEFGSNSTFSANDTSHNIVIPLEIQNGQLFTLIQADSAVFKCLVDTGSGSNFFLTSAKGELSNFVATGNKETSVKNQTVMQLGYLDKVSLWGMSKIQIPIWSINSKNSPYLIDNEGKPIQGMLGNFFLQNYLVTIDCPKSSMTLHKQNFDINSVSLKPGDSLLDIDFLCEPNQTCPSAILLPGTLEGVEVKFMLDTGLNSNEVVIEPGFRKKLRIVARDQFAINVGSLFGRYFERRTSELKWKIGSISGKSRALTLAKGKKSNRTIDPVEAYIGWEQLKQCRITIDYKHKKKLLQKSVPDSASNIEQQGPNQMGQKGFPKPHMAKSIVRRRQTEDGFWEEVPVEKSLSKTGTMSGGYSWSRFPANRWEEIPVEISVGTSSGDEVEKEKKRVHILYPLQEGYRRTFDKLGGYTDEAIAK